MTERLIKRGETSGRIDDNEETIKKRLVTFHEETTPILGYYGKQGKLVTIDAHRRPSEVFGDVSQALEGLMAQHQVGKRIEFIFLFTFLHMCVCMENSFQSDSDRTSSNKGSFVIFLLSRIHVMKFFVRIKENTI
jgi:hypothetical protein